MKFYTTNNETNYTYCLKSFFVRMRGRTTNTHICVGQDIYTARSNRKMETIT